MSFDEGESCLICSCSSKDAPLQSLSGYNNSKLSYNNQLQVVLLLRKVLRLRKRFLESVLENTGQNPSAWNLKLCGLCHRIFEEASFVSNRLNKLNEEFEELSLSLRSKIALSSGSDIFEDENGVEVANPSASAGSKSRRSGHGRRRSGMGRLPRKRHRSIEQKTKDFDVSQTSLPHKIRREVCRPSEIMPRLQRAKEYHGAFDEVDDGPVRPTRGKAHFNNKHIKIEVNELDTPEHDDVAGEEEYFEPMQIEAESSIGLGHRGQELGMESHVLYGNLENVADDINGDDDYAPLSPDHGPEDGEWLNNDLPRDEEKESDSDYDPSFEKLKANNKRQRRSRTRQKRTSVRRSRTPENRDDSLDRLIKEGMIEELTYNTVPYNEDGEDSGRTEANELNPGDDTSQSEAVTEVELPRTKFSVPFVQTSGKLVLPKEYYQLPPHVLKLLEAGPEDKKCPLCQKGLPTEIQLQAHIKAFHEGEKCGYQCPMCPKKVERIGMIMLHLQQIHLQRKRHFCDHCGQTFKKDILLQAHIQRNHFGITLPYKCKFCESRHARMSALNYHLIKNHQVQIESYVPIPNGDRNKKRKLTKSEGQETKKVATEEGQRKIVRRSNRPARYKPRKYKQKRQNKKFPCQSCKDEGRPGVGFATAVDLDVHIKRTHLGIPRPFPCPLCLKKYSSPLSLEKHMSLYHTVRSDLEVGCDASQTTSFSCFPCNKSFPNERLLNVHLQGTFHKNVRPHICELCSKAFRSLTFLKHHQSQVHYKELDLEPNKCKYCGKILNNKRTLNDHIRTTHTKDANFKCPHCDQCFQYRTGMNLHINIRHTKKDIFICPECPKTFTSGDYLRYHQLRVHSGLKPYECKFCQKKFADQSTYNRHVEAHSNIIHDCPHCGKTGFKTRHSLRVHVRTAHGDILSSIKSQTSIIVPQDDDSKVSQTSESATTSQEDNFTGQPENVQFEWDDSKPFPE